MSAEEKIKQAIVLLQKISEDIVVPRNIRKIASQAIDTLNNRELSPGLRAANVISVLEEVSEDPNIPLFTRTSIWQIVTILEQVKD